MNIKSFDFPVKLYNGEMINLTIYPEQMNTCFIIDKSEAEEYGESQFQLCESCSYEYEISKSTLMLEVIEGISKHFHTRSYGGSITTGIYTGTLTLRLFDKERQNEECGLINLEVRSVKANYRTDYRLMLEEITEKCSDLLMQYSSPVTQSYEVSFEDESKTLYQRFAFVKSIILSDEFQSAVHKIILSPLVRWDEDVVLSDIRNTKRFDSSQLRQIASSTIRVKTPQNHPLRDRISSLPEKIIVKSKRESVDTQENRFIKHVLTSFNLFVTSVRIKFKKNSRAMEEAIYCENYLEECLSYPIFKDISSPQFLGLNSPVLQRREGYREIYKSWLMFELASRLVWKGGDDVYEAGKRDVATLYEYWLYFKLLDLFQLIFKIQAKSIDELIEETPDGLSLKLKSGKHIPLLGTFYNNRRNLNIQFSYNRTFRGNTPYPKSGSWSLSMRPDYTLSIWPCDFGIEEAERQEVIIHIHFDAKYKVRNIKEVFGKELSEIRYNTYENSELNDELLEQKKGIYKRADLLKMHAYKDAVRRTAGSFVLYPGTEYKSLNGFHEIIPGLGAFSIRPSKEDTGITGLGEFIMDVINNNMNRISQYERLSYYTYDIFQQKENLYLKEAIPEKYCGRRSKPPTDVFVIVGYFQKKQKEWIDSHGLYNIRFNNKVTTEMISAKYILLYGNDEKTSLLYEVIGEGVEIWTKERLENCGYPNPSKEEYFVFNIRKAENLEFKEKIWNVHKLKHFKPDYSPFAVSLSDLMGVSL